MIFISVFDNNLLNRWAFKSPWPVYFRTVFLCVFFLRFRPQSIAIREVKLRFFFSKIVLWRIKRPNIEELNTSLFVFLIFLKNSPLASNLVFYYIPNIIAFVVPILYILGSVNFQTFWILSPVFQYTDFDRYIWRRKIYFKTLLQETLRLESTKENITQKNISWPWPLIF